MRTMNMVEYHLNEEYRKQGWGVVAEAAGLDPVNTEGQARIVCLYAARELGKLRGAMNEFCDRVERGEVRSKKTYKQFCELLGRAEAAPRPY